MTMTVWHRTTSTRFRGRGRVAVARTSPGLSRAAIFSLLWIARQAKKATIAGSCRIIEPNVAV